MAPEPSSTTSGAPRQLYVWWKTRDAAAAVALARAWQRQLIARLPGLRAELLRREPDSGDVTTLMEVYAHPAGLDDTAVALIAQGDEALAPGLAGPRVTEVFVPAGG